MEQIFTFRSRIEIGKLPADEMRAAMKAMGMTLSDLDRWIAGNSPDWHGLRGRALKQLVRQDVGDQQLRTVVHLALMKAADQQLAFLARKLDADLIPAN